MTRLILASGSESRRQILQAAGIPFEIEAPNVDEAAIKAALLAERAAPEAVAAALAEQKALRVSGRRPGVFVLGGDQVLVCEGRLFDKAESLETAHDVLRRLRGREHRLVTALALARDEAVIWRHLETSHLWMRDFSDVFLDRYLVDEGEDILSTVGCYRIEGRGAQLFERIEGDLFAIRGLPLIPLLHALRRYEVLSS